ncbi:hypothetical protein K8369_24420 [Streptomyces sp. PSKA30]|nr:hypothetical protein [Streptomyces sp. PSKA30]
MRTPSRFTATLPTTTTSTGWRSATSTRGATVAATLLEAAEQWAAKTPAWATAPTRALDVFATELRRLGFTTTACCQDVGEATAGVRAQRDTPLGYGGDGFIAYRRGHALVKMPTADAQRLATLLADTEAFGDRIRRPWSVGSWRMNVPLEPEGPSAEARLHFPRTQIPELVAALR